MSAMLIPSSGDNRVKTFIKRNPLPSMYFIMFTLAWSIMIPQALHSQGLLSAPVPGFFDILTGWSPGIAAILVSAAIAGRRGVGDLLRRFLIWRVGRRWYIAGAFLMALVILGGIGLHVAFGGATPAISAADASLAQIGFIFLAFVLLGFLINTEEIAWRGFALPRLQSRHGGLAAALLITIPETLLHLPLFWDKSNPFFQSVGLGWFSAFTAAAVFIYVYIFNRTGGSLVIVTLLHASQNAWANLLADNTPGPFFFSVALLWVLALALIILTRGSLGHQAGQQP